MRLYLSEGERYPHLYFATEDDIEADPSLAPSPVPWVDVPDEVAERLITAWREWRQVEREVEEVLRARSD